MMLERMFLLKVYSKMGKILPILITFFILTLARVFFRVDTLSDALAYLRSLFSSGLPSSVITGDLHFYFIMAAGFVFSFIGLFKFGVRMEEKFYYTLYTNRQHVWFTSLYAILLALCIASLSGSGFSPFIYFRF